MSRQRKKIDAAEAELEIVREIRRRAAQGARSLDLPLGIGDDCAVLRARVGEDLAVTTDLSIAGRHFRLDWHPAEAVGRRTLARGLSDLAAMGARPVAAFLSLGVPRELTVVSEQSRRSSVSWVTRFLDGFFDLAKAYGVPLAGGDLAESPVALADIVLVGAVLKGKALQRSGARPGDFLYVTGSLGGATAGLARLAGLAASGDPEGNAVGPTPEEWRDALAAQLHPKPRVAQGLALRRRGLATAAIDISDGLSTDLAHLCEESRVHAVIETGALPLTNGATLEQALHGGEDYELLFTARPLTRIPRAIAGVPITRIGHITKPRPRQPAVTLAKDGVLEPLQPRGWQHFTVP